MSEDRIVLVTGANKGIGFEVCRQLAARQFRVYLTARCAEQGRAACARLKESGLSANFLQLDVTDPHSIRAAAETLKSQPGHLDVLINNAGICEDAACSVLEIGPQVARRTIETNTLGPLWVTQAFWPLLAQSASGRIINVSSGLGSLHHMGSGYPSYRLSKAALNALTRILASELAPRRIAVNSVSPGWVRTDMGGSSATSSVEEGADTIVWLATEAPPTLTGQFLADRKPSDW